jgi:hypothetical protein
MFKFWRQPTEREKGISLEEIQDTLKFSEQSLADQLHPIVEKMVNDALVELKAIVRAKRDSNALQIRHGAEYAQAIAQAYRQAIKNGQAIASKDLHIEAKDLPNLEPYVDMVAQAYSDRAAADLKFILLANLFRRISTKEIIG